MGYVGRAHAVQLPAIVHLLASDGAAPAVLLHGLVLVVCMAQRMPQVQPEHHKSVKLQMCKWALASMHPTKSTYSHFWHIRATWFKGESP